MFGSAVAATEKSKFELSQLPPTFFKSRWTVYLDHASHLDTRRISATEKWLGSVDQEEVAIIVVRPDGYVGTIKRSKNAGSAEGKAAVDWLDSYLGGFLQAPEI
jgi:hypothetical protein